LVNDVYMNDLKRDPDFGRLSKSVDCDAQGKFTLGGVRNSFNNWSSLSWISCPRVFTSFIGAVPSMFEKDS
jgi:hypothetical protein